VNTKCISLCRYDNSQERNTDSPLPDIGVRIPCPSRSATSVCEVASPGLDGAGGPVCISISSNAEFISADNLKKKNIDAVFGFLVTVNPALRTPKIHGNRGSIYTRRASRFGRPSSTLPFRSLPNDAVHNSSTHDARVHESTPQKDASFPLPSCPRSPPILSQTFRQPSRRTSPSIPNDDARNAVCSTRPCTPQRQLQQVSRPRLGNYTYYVRRVISFADGPIAGQGGHTGAVLFLTTAPLALQAVRKEVALLGASASMHSLLS